MARGAPDYSNARASGPLHRLDDLGELAARMGSCDTFDRRGDVVFIDDFAHGKARWDNQGTGSNSELSMSATYVRSGPYSAKIAGGPEANKYARVYGYLPYLPQGRIGLELTFTLDPNARSIRLGFVGIGRPTQFRAAVRYYLADNALKYQYGDTDFAQFAVGDELKTGPAFFHTMKLVIDTLEGGYVRFLIDDLEYDLLPYNYYSYESDQANYLYVRFWVYNELTLGVVSYIDNIILTQNEP